jgi:Ser/Thr protein kinase RdoA (MazF antagonist)
MHWVLGYWWRPAWEQVRMNDRLWHVLRPSSAAVGRAAEQLATDIAPLLADADTQTLLHTDINPSNVLV